MLDKTFILGRGSYGGYMTNWIITQTDRFKGENHELSRSGKPTHRLMRLSEITSWMDKFLKA